MSLFFYLEKGASLDPGAPCLTLDGVSRSYGEVVELADAVARALRRSGVAPGDKVGILSANDPTAFTCVFGISRAGAVWCPINPRNAAGENAELLDLFDCTTLIFQPAFEDLVGKIAPNLPKLTTLVRLGDGDGFAPGFRDWSGQAEDDPSAAAAQPDDVVALVGTGGTTGRPKGVMLTDRNLEVMSAITLMSYPFEGRPVYLALAPLTHAAGVLCFPVLARGGEVVIMPKPDVGRFLELIERHRVTHTFLPPTLIYLVLGHEALDTTDLSSLQCFWYGAAPMSTARLTEALDRIGPMAQLFGQSEAPMMISTMSPAEHRHPDGTVHTGRLSSAGRPSPLVTVAILDAEGKPGTARRTRRDLRARLAGDGGLLPQPRGDGGGVRPRLAPHRRHRLPRRRRLPPHRRPGQGHGHHRRVQRLLRRGRAGRDGPRGRPRLRRDRPARRQVGRARHGRRPAADPAPNSTPAS